MKDDEMLMCLIAFVLGYLFSRMTSGNGLSVGGQLEPCHFPVENIENQADQDLIDALHNKCSSSCSADPYDLKSTCKWNKTGSNDQIKYFCNACFKKPIPGQPPTPSPVGH
jgi:hypothetical protein